MDTRVLVLAGGGGRRGLWRTEVHSKHMIPVRGEPLLHRTVRLLAGLGAADIVVMADEDCGDYVIPPARHSLPRHPAAARDRGWVQEWEPSRHLWLPEGRTLILYGDVLFSEPLLRRMVGDPGDPWHVYARHGGSANTGKPYGEMWGWVFTHSAHPALDRAQAEAIAWRDSGLWRRALGWEVYRRAMGQRPDVHCRDDRHFVDWDDLTEDFDSPAEWDEWCRRNPGGPI